MSKIPEAPKFKPSVPSSKMFVCWEPGTTEAEKEQGMKEIEAYMAYRAARAKKRAAPPLTKGKE